MEPQSVNHFYNAIILYHLPHNNAARFADSSCGSVVYTLLQSSLQERSKSLSGVALAKVLQETNITKLLN
jgi:hypothetical protein